ncbi:MAG: protein kinase [Gemmataceae bacterium]
MSTAGSKSEIVLALAEEFLERYRKGERPALREYTNRHPDLADDIREVFPAMAMMENVALADESLADRASGGCQPPGLLTQIGDYRVLREVGRGGMGVVYEAEQVSLGRHVALKLLPKAMLRDANTRRRFEREAKAAAKLHHTNIVPVFGVGEDDGQPYYVMQFIRGHALDDVLAEVKRLQNPTAAATATPAADVARSLVTGSFRIDEVADDSAPSAPSSPSTTAPSLPADDRSGRKLTYWQSVALLAAQVADALDYAHRQGVLHRDVKPSNLLLDARGTVWVTDFGLAKSVGDDNLTATGDILGTLRYMPPEAFDGKTDARGDVYSLGITLYEMLALQPAFGERDRAKLVKLVTAGDPPPLRSVNAAIPRDLQTVVRKAVERDPGHRYATAGELADDLRRFAADEPIHARTVGPAERLWRWCRRNPALAAALAAVVLVTAGGFATTYTQMRIAKEYAQQSDVNAADAFHQKGVAEARRIAQEGLNAKLLVEKAQQRRTLYAAHLGLAATAWERSNFARLLNLLEQHRPRDGEADLRGFEWYYWKRRAHAEMRAFQVPQIEHDSLPGRNRTIDLSADGSRVVAATADGVGVWDVATGKNLRRLAVTQNAVAISPDGRWFATYRRSWTSPSSVPTPSEIVVYDVEDPKKEYRIAILAEEVGIGNEVLFSTDSTRLVVWSPVRTYRPSDGAWRPITRAGSMAVYDFVAGSKVPVKLPADDQLAQIDLRAAPDNRLIVHLRTAQPRDENGPAGRQRDSRLGLFDATTGEALPTPPAFSRAAAFTAVSPDGKRLLVAVSSDDPAEEARRPSVYRVVEVATDKELGKIVPPTAFGTLRFGADGNRVVGSGNGTSDVYVWDANSGALLNSLHGHPKAVAAVAFQRDASLLITADAEGAVKTWDLTARAEEVSMPASYTGRSGAGHGVSSDGRRSVDLRVMAPRDPQQFGSGPPPEWRLTVHDERDGAILLRSWKPKAGQGGQSGLNTTIFSPDGGKVAMIAPRAGEADANGEADGPPLALMVWDVASKAEIPVPAERQAATYFAFRGDGRAMAGTFSNRRRSPDAASAHVAVWELATGKTLHTLPLESAAHNLAYSADGRRVAVVFSEIGPNTSARSSIRVYELADGSEVARYDLTQRPIGLLFSPDGRWLAAAGQPPEEIVLLDLARQGPEARVLSGHGRHVNDLAFTPDSRRLASLPGVALMGLVGEIKVWDPVTGQEVLTLNGPSGRNPLASTMVKIRFSADGHKLYAFGLEARTTYDATPLVANIEAADVAEALPRRATRAEVEAELGRLALSPALNAAAAKLARLYPPNARRSGTPLVDTSESMAIIVAIYKANATAEEYRKALAETERVKTAREGQLAVGGPPLPSSAWSRYGGALYRLGRYEEAATALKRAEEASRGGPGREAPHGPAFQAMTYHRLGKLDEAKAALARMRDLKTANPPRNGYPDEIVAFFAEVEALVDPKH